MMLYFHIPFCVRKCFYCDFVSFAGQEGRITPYVDALIREMNRRPCGESITSVFLGGGTPSLLPEKELKRLFSAIRERYALAERCEITSECNPGTVTEMWLDAAVECGINRLSVGIQATQEELLKRIGRIHTFAEAQETFALAKRAGICNLSADLMYALPGQTVADWEESLKKVTELEPSHVSCYALTVAEDTPFGNLDKKGELPRCPEDEELEMQERTAEILEKCGIFQYEVSNYAKPGCASRHNLGYWTRADYLGFGCAAHSKEGNIRRANGSGLEDYINGAGFASEEALSQEDEWFEELMLGLRLKSGIRMSQGALERFGEGLARFEKDGFLAKNGEFVRLTEKGFPVMNSILSELM